MNDQKNESPVLSGETEVENLEKNETTLAAGVEEAGIEASSETAEEKVNLNQLEKIAARQREEAAEAEEEREAEVQIII